MGSKFKLLKTCHHCGGTGEVPIYSSPNAPPQGTMICPECEGNGKILIGKG